VVNQFTRNESIGFVNFDSGGNASNTEVEIRVPIEKMDDIQRGKYVIIESGKKNFFYLSRISKGPFFTPDAVHRESAFAKASIIQADKIAFLPDYHGICFAELLGMFDLDSSHLTGFQTRPHPKSSVFQLPAEKIESLLKLRGNLYLGQPGGYPEIRVYFDSNKKSVLPRNIGIFGTVGSGKTNSAQVLIEEACCAGWAVIVLDVEGEYIEMDKPSSEIGRNKNLREIAEKQFKIRPAGLDNFQVYFPSETETNRKDALEFSIPFGGLSPYELSEIMGMNETQEDRFISLWDEVREDVIKPNSGGKKKNTGNTWKLIEEYGPDGIYEEDNPEHTLGKMIQKLTNKLNNSDDARRPRGADRSSWQVVKRLLGRLRRFQIFDSADDLQPAEFLKPGKVSVLDLSGSYNVRVNNIVIAYLLRKVFDLKIKKDDLPPTIIFIEEAHTFVSRENASKMEALLDRLREVARRGRKRWLSLCFISQQPSHMPDEIYELCNTKLIHQTTGNRNLNALKISSGGVNEALWTEVPILGQGRCVIVSPQYQHPIMANIRPCKTNRMHTE
jgi:hypothetical protein